MQLSSPSSRSLLLSMLPCSTAVVVFLLSPASVLDSGLSHTLGQDDVLVLGRQDYMVRSMRVDSKAETWNATFSRLYMMSRDSNSIKDFFRSGAAPKLGGVRARAGGWPRRPACLRRALNAAY